jgi:hypothetical protein
MTFVAVTPYVTGTSFADVVVHVFVVLLQFVHA